MLILTPADWSALAPPPADAWVDWALSTDGQTLGAHGRSRLTELPEDGGERVLVTPPRALSWHRVALPKVGAARWRAALDGLLEDRLLQEPSALHMALAPGARGGDTVWVAVADKSWLQGWLLRLAEAGRAVGRVVPGMAPGEGEALAWVHGDDPESPWLSVRQTQGVWHLPLAAATPERLETEDDGLRWRAEPAVSAAAEARCGRPCPLWTRGDWLLAACASAWDLAQFDLRQLTGARRWAGWRRGLQTLWHAPAWRPARWGLALLLLAQLAGLNALAWHRDQTLQARQAAVGQVLRDSFPDVGLVLDAPRQMAQALNRLSRASAAVQPHDLEALLTTLGGLPGLRGPALVGLRYAADEVELDLSPEAMAARTTLEPALMAAGWRVRHEGDQRLLLSR